MKKFPFEKGETTVLAARGWLTANAREGVLCPCCDQEAKVYRRPLHATMARALLIFWKHQKGRSQKDFHAPTVLNGAGAVSRGGDFAKLVHWGLLEQGETVGRYRLTSRAEEFICCRIAVPRAVYLYNGSLVASEEESQYVTIADVLGDVEYEELFAGTDKSL